MLEENGKEVAQGQLDDLDIPPHSQKQIQLQLPKVNPEPGVEYFLTLRFIALDNLNPMIPAGHELAFEQFKLPEHQASITVGRRQTRFVEPETRRLSRVSDR